MTTFNPKFLCLVSLAVAALALQSYATADDCCGGHGGSALHGAHAGSPVKISPSLGATEPIASVLANYARIQSALASDSLEGVKEAAAEISKLVDNDSTKLLPAETATQSAALAKDKELAAAREDFKQLSATLIEAQRRKDFRTGSHYIVYCDMAKAGWLQTDKTIRNPYFGASMATCGEIKKTF